MLKAKTITDSRLPFIKRSQLKSELSAKCMVMISLREMLRRIASSNIRNKIASGTMVYFESPFEELAFRYAPNGIDRLGKYYVKYYGQDEYEIDFNSTFVLKAIMEGYQISKTRYDNFHLIKGVLWYRHIQTPETLKSVGN